MTPGQVKIREHRADPVKFVRDRFKIDPDPWQKDALQAFASKDPKHFRISLQACAGPGKSAVLAWCGWNFLSCYGSVGEHPKAAAMSISHDNLKDNLWAEMSKWQERDEFLKRCFQWTSERIYAKDHKNTWFMSARAVPKKANEEEIGRVLSGLHSKFVLYLVDESGDISPQVLKSAEQGLATADQEFGKIMQAGNPTSQDGMLYAASKDGHWFVIRITGDPDDPKRSSRINIVWAGEMIKKYGRQDPWVMSYILGEFPPGGINVLITPDEVRDSIARQIKPPQYDFAQKRLGIDVARFGDDRTIIFPRQGLRAFKCVEMRAAKTQEIVGRAMAAKIKWGSEMEFVDGTGGFGAGVIDGMQLGGASPQEIHFSGKAIDPRYLNKRAENWFLMTQWAKKHGVLPNDQDLIKELSAPRYYFQNGKFQLESKDQIKARLKFSPDKADALSLTFSLPDMPAAFHNPFNPRGGGSGQHRSDYDATDDTRR